MFSTFGWADIRTSGDADIYLTGLEFNRREHGTDSVDIDRIDIDAFLRLKERFFE